MNMRNLFFVLLLLCPAIFYAQSGGWQWAVNSNGVGERSGYHIATDRSGNIYVGGLFNDTGLVVSGDTITPSCTICNTDFLVKFNTSGQPVWAKSAFGLLYVTGVAVEHAGNVYVEGFYNGEMMIVDGDTIGNTYFKPGATWHSVFLLKLDTLGNLLWWKTSLGGGQDDIGQAITVDNESNVVITGFFNDSFIIFDGVRLENQIDYRNNMFLVKWDSSGNIKWANSTNNLYSSGITGNALTTDFNENIFIAGTCNGSFIYGLDTMLGAPQLNAFFLKVNSDGNALWARGSNGSGEVTPQSVACDVENNFYVSGYCSGTPVIGSDTISIDSPSYYGHLFLTKMDADGNQYWLNQILGGDEFQYADAVTVDGSENVYLIGSFAQADRFVVNYNTIFDNRNCNVHVVLYYPDGTLKWVSSFMGVSAVSSDICIDESDNFYVCGTYQASNFTIGTDTLINTNTTMLDMFLAKYAQPASVPYLSQTQNDLLVYPNPVVDGGVLNVKFSTGSYTKLAVYSELGAQLADLAINPQAAGIQFRLPELVPGLYYLKATGSSSTATISFVVSR